MLKMKRKCEACGTGLPLLAEAYICSYECSFCADCTKRMRHVCPNCNGELVRRPPRAKQPVAVAGHLLKRRLGLGN